MSSKNYLDKNGLTYFWGKIQNEISPKANTSDVLTKTNTTSYTPSANYHPATKKYVDDKGFADLSDVFVITCSSDSEYAHIIDKTWTEITTAYNNGKLMCCTFDGRSLFFLTNYNSSQDGIINFEFEFGATKVIVWDVTYNQDGNAWDYGIVSDVVYIEVSYNNGTYSIDTTALEILDMIVQSKTVVLVDDVNFYYLSDYNNLDNLELYFLNYNGILFKMFTVRDDDLNGVTTVIFSSQQTQSDWNENTSTNPSYIANKPSIKAGTGDNAVIINDYYNLPCVASGDGALSEGGATTASGTVSHSEGQLTIAEGNYSHAENMHTLAYGVGSHSEGGVLSGNITISGAANTTTYTVDSGCPRIYGTAADIAIYVELYYNNEYYYPTTITISDEVITSITLGSTLDENNPLNGTTAKLYFRTVAKGKGSHAEGGATYTHAEYSHAEGKQTHTAGKNSHSEGLLTIAASDNQHVQGKNNIIDSAGIYAHIVGNGTSSSARSNAHTLDWNGNGWYAGKLTVGAAPTNTLDVATKGYVDSKELSDLSDIFIIECTTENNTPVVDKTWTEITTAYNAGKKIFAKHGSFVFPLTKFSQSSSSLQGYVAFYSPSPSFNPNLDPYLGGQWRFSEECIVVWDTTWSGQDGEMDSWNTAFMPEGIPVVTWYEDPNDSSNFVMQQINNDYGNSIFMNRYDPNGYSGFTLGSSTTLSTTYYNPSVSNNITLSSSGVSITSSAGVSIQNVVTPTNNTDAATKGYVDSAVSGFSTNLSGLTDTTISSPSSGQVLSYDSTSSKWVNADVPSDVMVVKITGSDNNGYTADKTFAEIRAARLAGACVILRYSIYSWYLHAGASTSSSNSDLYFGTLMGGADYYWKISSANVVTKLTNDFVNTINGQTGNVTLSIPTKTSDLTNDSGFVTTDTNTTYTISISSNVITLTPSSGQAQSITLPVYDGSVSSS